MKKKLGDVMQRDRKHCR